MSAKTIPYLRLVESLIITVLLRFSFDIQQSSLAQEPPPPPPPAAAPEKVEELEINIYGERLLNKPIYSPFRKEGTLKDSTRPAYVINKDEIKAQGARTVREALQSLPGILGAGTVGTEVNVLSNQFIRGSNGTQVLILLDGRPINNLGSGGFDLSEFSTSIVDRIEVLPGGGSTLYGSDAIGGIINIVTSRPTSDKLTFSTQAEVGNLGYTKFGVNASKRDGNIGWLIGYDLIQANNNYAYSIPAANFSGTRVNNDVKYDNLRVRADVDLSDRTKLSFNSILLFKNQGSPGGVPIPTPQFGQGFFNTLTDANRKYTDQILFDVGIDQKLGNGNDSTLTGRVYYDNLSTRFDNRTAFAESLSVTNGQVVKTVTPQVLRQFDNKQKTLGIQTQHNWQITPTQNITYGFDYRNTNNRNTTNNIALGTQTVGYDGTISQGALFAQYNVDLNPQIRATAGLRQDFSSLTNGSATSPALGIKWDLNSATTLRANYIRNFRTPTLSNLFSVDTTFIGNPNLLPEIGNSFDVGVDQKLGDFGLLRLTAFQNNISNVIAFQSIQPPVNGISGTFTNIGEVQTQGIEASLNARLAPNFYGFVNYTLNNPQIKKDTNLAVVGKELRFAGADKLSMGVSYENTFGWYSSLALNSLSGYPTNNTNTEFLSGFTSFDFNFVAPMNSDRSVTLNASVQNIFDQRYELFAGFPDAGRTFRTGIDWKF
ncbi:TonB-dependent receptor [Chamaesiphon minutus]|uniref:Outer membrane cobalamin receptor protein n=1 Tax=Chamaesiphon minutus (strain ATCC 27169 / PCC 6605) TaxID=1173020 RepID=K9UEY6_CHAP6|nr:TonB-dependent receptor [Chamaesiphon minutus]AFY93375.1 outer membrane cobalamin receptor protein [Chamaesiphon minutus PCC 6605]